jgi:hypothetical protein
LASTNSLDDRERDPGAVRVAALRPLEAIEDAVDVLRRNAHAFVNDREALTVIGESGGETSPRS